MMRRGARTAVAAALLLAAAGCRSTPDPQDVEGIEFDADEVFRYVDYPGADPDRVYDVARRIVRIAFAGTRLVETPDRRLIETLPSAFRQSPERIQFYLSVSGVEGGSRVEILAMVERLREHPEDDPDDPWELAGRDAKLENLMFEKIWQALNIQVPSAAPDPGPAPPSGG